MNDALQIALGALQGVLSSTVFILVLMVGFCVLFGFTKTKRTSGNALVVKSLDEVVSRNPVAYLGPRAPRGPADQLQSPELLEAAGRK